MTDQFNCRLCSAAGVGDLHILTCDVAPLLPRDYGALTRVVIDNEKRISYALLDTPNVYLSAIFIPFFPHWTWTLRGVVDRDLVWSPHTFAHRMSVAEIGDMLKPILRDFHRVVQHNIPNARSMS